MKLILSSAKTITKKGFTLLELLVVIGIIAMLLVLATPAIIGMVNASKLTSTGEEIISIFSNAQQIANAEGRPIQVRIYSHSDPSDGAEISVRYRTLALLRNYQIGEANPSPKDGESNIPLTEPINIVIGDIVKLPDSVGFVESSDASPILTDLDASSDDGDVYRLTPTGLEKFAPAGISEGTNNYVAFNIKPEGTDLQGSSQWFLTLAEMSAIERNGGSINAIPNFFCVSIDPINGRITSYRP